MKTYELIAYLDYASVRLERLMRETADKTLEREIEAINEARNIISQQMDDDLFADINQDHA